MKRTATAFLALLLSSGACLLAQNPREGGAYDYNYIVCNSPWLTSSNAAGLTVNPAGKIAVAELSFGKRDGGLKGNEESPNSFEYGVQAESYYRLSDKIAFWGSLGYSGFRGQNMGGSILVNPDYNPVNFYESDPANKGIVTRENYSVNGGISYSFSPRWSIGAKVNYDAGNSTKRKDPRYRSTLMDMTLSLGGRFAPCEMFEVGLDFIYRKTTENILGKLYADTSIKYYTLVDYGGYWGKYELFEGDLGYVSLTNRRPMLNNFYGGAAQLVFNWGKVRFFNELKYLYRTGYYGNKSESSVVFSSHNAHCIAYSGNLNITGENASRHIVGLGFDMERLKNFENSYKYETPSGESTIVKYLGENQRLQRTLLHAQLSYTGYWGIEGNLPRWEGGAVADYNLKKTYATFYPDSRRQNISTVSAEAFARCNFTVGGSNILSGGVSIEGLGGWGVKNLDERTGSSTSATPKTSEEYLNIDFENRTLARLGEGLCFKYTRLFPSKGISAYILLKDTFIHSVKNVEYMSGKYRNFAEIRIGCTF